MRTCSQCPSKIGKDNKSGLCVPCLARRKVSAFAADPAIRERQRQGRIRYLSDPENRARISAHLNARMADFASLPPAEQDARRSWGKQLARDYLTTPENQALIQSPENRALQSRTREEKALGWCPPEWRAEYRRLLHNGHMTAAEVRAIIEAEIPGTVEHARRQIASAELNQKLRQVRDRLEAY